MSTTAFLGLKSAGSQSTKEQQQQHGVTRSPSPRMRSRSRSRPRPRRAMLCTGTAAVNITTLGQLVHLLLVNSIDGGFPGVAIYRLGDVSRRRKINRLLYPGRGFENSADIGRHELFFSFSFSRRSLLLFTHSVCKLLRPKVRECTDSPPPPSRYLALFSQSADFQTRLSPVWDHLLSLSAQQSFFSPSPPSFLIWQVGEAFCTAGSEK